MQMMRVYSSHRIQCNASVVLRRAHDSLRWGVQLRVISVIAWYGVVRRLAQHNPRLDQHDAGRRVIPARVGRAATAAAQAQAQALARNHLPCV